MDDERARETAAAVPARAERERRPRGLLLSIAVGLLAVVVNAIVCGLASMVFILLGMLLSVLVALFWDFAVDLGDDPMEGNMGAWFALFLLVASSGLVSSFSGLGELALWIPGGEVAPAEVASHRWARMFTLREAEARPELPGYHRSPGSKRGSGTSHRVVPLVPPGWTRAAPVAAWAVCPEARCEQVTRRPRFATRPASFASDGLSLAAREAAARHGLQVAPGAPVLEVGLSAGDVLRQRGFILLMTGVVFGVPWLVLLVVGWFKRRRQGASGEG